MENNVKVAISTNFLTAFARLPKAVQGKTTEFINKFRNNPRASGINYEKIQSGSDSKIWSVRIDGTYRGIVVREDETGVYILLWVDHHDEAYDWAKRKRCEVNPKTGAIQVFDIRIEEKTVSGRVPGTEASEDGAEKNGAKAMLFAELSDQDLLDLHVPRAQISFVRDFADKQDFFAAKDSFAEDAYEALSWILEDIPVQEVKDMLREEHGEEKTPVSGSLSEALEKPETLKSFVVVEGEEELRRIMAEPLEKWRVFLHPTQRKIVQKNYSGPARVLGGAGTGKTVVAMHRAKYLASKLPEDSRVLFTTFTANLAEDIRDNLKKICSDEEMKHIEVIHLDSWVNQYLREVGYSAVIVYGDAIDRLWDEAMIKGDNALGLDREFYKEEWVRVAIGQEALTKEAYCKASRNGRGTRLDRKKRIAVWKVLDAYQTLMKEKGIRDINTAMYECTKLIADTGSRTHYQSIIVDEGQDLGNNAYRLLRALAGEEHPNDLFIVGDAHQRIYKNKPVLAKCGINVRGRSSILKINYRTTEEIRQAAFGLLKGISFDDLDGAEDADDRCQSLTHGSRPVVTHFDTAREESDYLLSKVKELTEQGVSLKDICVVARTRKLTDEYSQKFNLAGIRTYMIRQSKSDDRGLDGLRVATMHRVKGLEFQYVFIAAVNEHVVPPDAAISHTDEIAESETLTSERCLLYVAMTRAQKGVFITSYGKKSVFLG